MKLTEHATLVSAQIAALRAWAGAATSVTRAAIFRDSRGDRWVAFALADQSLSLRLPYGPKGALNTGIEQWRRLVALNCSEHTGTTPCPGQDHHLNKQPLRI